jgi:hypothetical protein
MPDKQNDELDIEEVGRLIRDSKRIAKDYQKVTGRPLGITGEVAEYEAARLLGLRLSGVRQPGYDASHDDGRRIQIKGRVQFANSKPGQRIGSIQLKYDWETVMLVLLDSDFEPVAIYEAQRSKVKEVLEAPGSRARNERGSMGVNKFRSIAELVWHRDQ